MTSSEAFDAFYTQGATKLARQIFAFTGDANEALDIAQEAYIRAWSRWTKVSQLDDPQAWVRRVAYNLAKNSARRRHHLSPFPAPQQVDDADPGERQRLELAGAMASLSAEHRQAIILHYLVGMSHSEIALQMGVPVGTVKSWLSRGRAHLAAALAALNSEDDDEPRRGARRANYERARGLDRLS
ncbi:MAG: SigE family RNA polymerase sigma factor [Acidimicrobiales bacterium]